MNVAISGGLEKSMIVILKILPCVSLFLLFSNQFLVCPMKHAAVLMTLDKAHRIVPLEDEVN